MMFLKISNSKSAYLITPYSRGNQVATIIFEIFLLYITCKQQYIHKVIYLFIILIIQQLLSIFIISFVYFVLTCLFTENAIIYMEFPVPITLIIQSGQTNKHTHTHTHTQQSRFNYIDVSLCYQ